MHTNAATEDKDLKGCYKINAADTLGDITIYNGFETGMVNYNHVAYYSYADGTVEGPIDSVTTDGETGVTIVKRRSDKELCLGNLVKITLVQPF